MLGHKYKLGEQVNLTSKAADQLMDSFGTMSGLNSPWTITAQTFSTISPSYTIRNIKGVQYEGIKEESLEPSVKLPLIHKMNARASN
ncbi:hypothetical protein CVT26_003997 [Gymnopilus dilepis]|uniref:Uncharacterized protein n=1 Tax=Gymnopilus dilepis TaxID=231916 RepID=A0A409YV71_9AGAR|nr:hypothetical protein CVT26_003997 [Gymnopilus dilepis]